MGGYFMISETFGTRLKKALKLKDMKPSELSKKTGIQLPLISNYLSDRYKPKQDRIYLIAKALNVNEAWLMGFDVTIERISDIERQEASDSDDLTLEILKTVKTLNIDQKKLILNLLKNMIQ